MVDQLAENEDRIEKIFAVGTRERALQELKEQPSGPGVPLSCSLSRESPCPAVCPASFAASPPASLN